MPTPVDDDFVLYEADPDPELASKPFIPEPALVSRHAKGRTLVEMYIELCDLPCTPHVATIIFPKRFLQKERLPKRSGGKAGRVTRRQLDSIGQ